MKAVSLKVLAGLSALSLTIGQVDLSAYAQAPAPAPTASAPQANASAQNVGAESLLLSENEMEILVARIALYPDELVGVISAASLFPLQIVEAQRFLEAKKKKSDLKLKSDWDGSVVSLLNYPDIVKMMSDDLEWTQALADALTNQQKDVLIAIQQLRDEAVAKNIITTDEKVTIVNENENIIIRPTNPEKIYIPQYPPEMLYQPNYQPAPVSYYPNSYENYYYPGAAFFAAAATGLAWAAVVNWDDWGVWGGNWRGDIDIDCNNCFNDRNFSGKVNWNDVDWTKVDRSKLSIDKDQLAKIDRTTIKSGLQSDNRNQLGSRVGSTGANRNFAPSEGGRADDIRRNTVQGLKNGSGGASRPNAPRVDARDGGGAGAAPKAVNRSGTAAGKGDKSKMGARPDNRPSQANALGDMQSGRREAVASERGGQSMGGGQRGGPRAQPQQQPRPSASQHRPRPAGGRGGGERR